MAGGGYALRGHRHPRRPTDKRFQMIHAALSFTPDTYGRNSRALGRRVANTAFLRAVVSGRSGEPVAGYGYEDHHGVEFAELHQRIREIVISLRMLRREIDRVTERLHRCFVLLQRAQCIAEIVVRVDVIRLHRDGLPETFGRRGRPVVRLHHVAEVEVIQRQRLARDCRHDHLGGRLVPTGPMCDETEQMHRIGVLRIKREHAAQERLRFVRTICLVLRERFG